MSILRRIKKNIEKSELKQATRKTPKHKCHLPERRMLQLAQHVLRLLCVPRKNILNFAPLSRFENRAGNSKSAHFAAAPCRKTVREGVFGFLDTLMISFRRGTPSVTFCERRDTDYWMMFPFCSHHLPHY